MSGPRAAGSGTERGGDDRAQVAHRADGRIEVDPGHVVLEDDGRNGYAVVRADSPQLDQRPAT